MTTTAQAIIKVAALTHRGAVRDRNEDTIALGRVLLVGDMNTPVLAEVDGETRMLIVADGMGGHARGELASRTALEAILDCGRPQDILAWREALLFANDRLYDLMRVRPEALGLGTTVVGVAFCADTLIHFNVGDSRAYRHSRGILEQISHDDVPSAPRGPEPRRASHQITQSLGGRLARTRIVPHVSSALPLRPSETILLCSDGLTDMLSDATIREVLDEGAEPSLSACQLMNAALQAGGHDNISVVIAAAY
jgi:protein phosphatase